MSYVKRQIVFNTENRHQRELDAWLTEQSAGNISGFVKAVLFAFKSGGHGIPVVGTTQISAITAPAFLDGDAMADIL
ncbi:hypothetical protein ACLBWT_01765 [Paenibacillus sp. D51F]